LTVVAPRAALLDRDGTINVKAAEGEYITAPSQVQLLPGAATAIRLLNRANVPAIVITNQRGIARGLMTEADLERVHQRLSALLADEGARIDAFFHCPHEAGTCACRKPGTLMLEWARQWLGLESLADTVTIGDSLSDVDAGLAMSSQPILLGPVDAAPAGVPAAASLLQAVREILPEPAAETVSA